MWDVPRDEKRPDHAANCEGQVVEISLDHDLATIAVLLRRRFVAGGSGRLAPLPSACHSRSFCNRLRTSTLGPSVSRAP